MKTAAELRKLRKAILKKMRALFDKANGETRDFTESEETEYKDLEEEAKGLVSKIERAEALEAEERELQDYKPPQPVIPQDQDERSDFQVGDKLEEKKPWESFGHFLRAVRAVPTNGGVDPRLMAESRAASGASEGVLTDGGFLISPQFSNELLNDAIETGVLAKKCRNMPMSRNSLTVPGVDETSRVDGSRAGGIRAYWEGEASSLTSSKPKFRAIELKAKKLTGLIYATDELLEDAPALGAYVQQGFSDEFGFKIDDVIINGTGAGEPLGIMNAGCKVQVSKETGQEASTINSNNITKMFARQMARGVNKATWYINQACWPQIFSLSFAVGTGGVPMYIEPGKLAYAPYGALLGRPIQPIEQCAALGTAGDIIFADMSQYLLAKKGGIQTASSMHVLFTTSEMAYRFVLRMDGQPIRASSLTPYKGSDTTSSFVVLQSR